MNYPNRSQRVLRRIPGYRFRKWVATISLRLSGPFLLLETASPTLSLAILVCLECRKGAPERIQERQYEVVRQVLEAGFGAGHSSGGAGSRSDGVG